MNIKLKITVKGYAQQFMGRGALYMLRLDVNDFGFLFTKYYVIYHG